MAERSDAAMGTHLSTNPDARERILRGVQRLAAAVKVTLGPSGRVVVLEKSSGARTVTKDGVTVAEEIELRDPYENLGAQMVKEVASKSSKDAGDGTTTATIYAETIFQEGLEHIAAGANPIQVKRGIDMAVATIVEELKNMSKPVSSSKEIAQVGTSSANQDEQIGKIIAEAMDMVGKDGVITVEEGKSLDTEVDLVGGMQFDRGFLSPHFMTNADDMTVEFDKCLVLIHENTIDSVSKLVPLLEKVVDAKQPLLIIAENITGEALATLVINKLRGTLQVCAVKAPGYGDRRKAMLEDIAVLTGAQPIMKELGIDLDAVELKHLGMAKKLEVDADNTTIIEGAGSTKDIQARIEQIRREIEGTTSDYDREELQERLAKLSGGVAQIIVGAASEAELKEKKARVEDALHACRAALEEGILPGGGVAVLRARRVLERARKRTEGDVRIGVDIVYDALARPLRQLAVNAGLNGSAVVDRVSTYSGGNPNFGFNALTHEYGDLVKMGVIVPTKVERVALQNAASVAGVLLLSDAAVVEIGEENAAVILPHDEVRDVEPPIPVKTAQASLDRSVFLHFRVTMPSRVTVKQQVAAMASINLWEGSVGEPGVLPAGDRVEVVVRAPTAARVDGSVRAVEFDRGEAAIQVDMTFVEPGLHRIGIDLLWCGNYMQTVHRTLVVVPEDGASDQRPVDSGPGVHDSCAPPGDLSVSPPEEPPIELPRRHVSEPDLELRISLRPDNRTLDFYLRSPLEELGYFGLHAGTVILNIEPQRFAEHDLKTLSGLARLPVDVTDSAEVREHEAEIIGMNLWHRLLPPEVRRQYERFRPLVRSMLIVSDEPWIPWELVKPVDESRAKHPYWCEHFAMTRWIAGSSYPSPELKIDSVQPVMPQSESLRALNDELEAIGELRRIRPELRVLAVLSQRAAVLRAIEKLDFGLMHMAAHGRFNEASPDSSWIRLDDGLLRPSDFAMRFLSSRRPVVVVNACHGARLDSNITGLGGWAAHLVERNAAAFLGAAWEVDDALALQFAKTFYAELLGRRGPCTIAEATRRARLAVRGQARGNSTWLAYALYAHPLAIVAPVSASKEGEREYDY